MVITIGPIKSSLNPMQRRYTVGGRKKGKGGQNGIKVGSKD
jgi:hypothetical protein